jgi:SOS-response transcriptional repressor LexA
VVLDFIGNHISFFRKPEALFNCGTSKKGRQGFINRLKNDELALPQGCYVNYDLQSIDFMTKLLQSKVNSQVAIYRALKDSKGRRPTLAEFYQAEGKLPSLKKEHKHWLGFVAAENDLKDDEKACLNQHINFFQEVEVTALTRSWKLILLEAMIEMDGFSHSPTTELLAQQSYQVLQRHPLMRDDLQENYTTKKWHTYWVNNPIKAWAKKDFFNVKNHQFIFKDAIDPNQQDSFYLLLQELIDYKFLQYKNRPKKTAKRKSIKQQPTIEITKIPYFENLKIACGHFKNSYQDDDIIKQKGLPISYGRLDPNKHFIAKASGNSMNGGRYPIVDGDYLLLEMISSNQAGSISNQILAIERDDVMGDGQYLLRYVKKLSVGSYELIAHNPDYEPMMTNESMRTFARFKGVIDPTDLV